MHLFGQPLIAGFIPRLHHCKVACFHSATVAVGYAGVVASAAVEAVLQFPDVATTLGLQQYVPPKYAGLFMFGLSALTLLARFRTILWKDQDHGPDHVDPGVRSGPA
jgi:hypothetical protein